MKKVIGITIILTAIASMLLPSVYSNLLQIEKYISKIIAHERLESELLTTIRIPVSDLVWYEEGKEIVYNKQLFDVESFVIDKDTIIITGLADLTETAINIAVNNLVDTDGSEDLLKYIGSEILHLTAFHPTPFSFRIHIDEYIPEHKDSYSIRLMAIIYKAIQTPPPDKFSC